MLQLLLVISLKTIANERLLFENYTAADGLSNGTIFCTLSDNQGFLWIGTDDGLNRYDGYNFKTYSTTEGNQKVTSNLQVTCIVEDTQNSNLWIGTSFGLYYYSRKYDKIIPFNSQQLATEGLSQLRSQVNCLYIDIHQNLWVGTYNGLWTFSLKDRDYSEVNISDFKVFQNIQNNSTTLSSNYIFSICEDINNNVLISSQSEYIDVFQPSDQTFIHHKIKIPALENKERLIKRILSDGKNIWIYTEGNGLILWDRNKNSFEEIIIKDKNNQVINTSIIRSLLIEDNNHLWIGTDGNGIIIYNKSTRLSSHYNSSNNYLSNISSNAIYSIYEDKQNTIWVGTYFSGLNKLDRSKSDFGLMRSTPFSTNGLNHHIVTSFLEDYQGYIWVGTDGGGIHKLDLNTYLFKQYKANPKSKNSLSTPNTVALFEDSEKNIWVGTYNGGINIYHPKTDSFSHIKYNKENKHTVNSPHPWGFAQDENRNMWIATVDAGLNLLTYGDTIFHHYTNENNFNPTQNTICSNAITYIYIDSNQNLWICTERGLDVVDLKNVNFKEEKPTLIFKHYQNIENKNSLSNNKVSYITEDQNGNMWIGTKGGGLNKLNLSTDNFTVYTTNDGLPHNIIQGILFDNDQNIWLSTNDGLAKFNPQNLEIETFNYGNGLQSSEFIKTSCLKAKDGTLYFGGVNGFNAFKPENIKRNTTPPAVCITGLKLFDKKINCGDSIRNRILLKNGITETKSIQLNYDENMITIGFTALNFISPEKNQFMVKLEGFEKYWRSIDAQIRNVTYTNLDPGEYTFRVIASNNNGEWNNEGASLTITIKPPWWKKIGFRILGIALFLSISGALYMNRIYFLTKQKKLLEQTVLNRTEQLQIANKELEELNASKDKFLSIIAHDILSPFNTIIGFSELLINNFHTLEEHEKSNSIKMIYGSSMSLYDLLENLLQWSKSERGMMEFKPQSISLNDIILTVINLFKFSAEAKNIKLSYKSEIDLMVFADKNLLNTIFRNLIGNALKFTHPNGEIQVSSYSVDDFIAISIKDNGVGMKKEVIDKLFNIHQHHSTPGTNNEKGSGLGLIIIQDFIKLQGGTLSIESEPGKGSNFTFTIPVSKETTVTPS